MIPLSQIQQGIVEFLHHCSGRKVAVEAPTGTGKTVAYLHYINEMLARGEIQKAVISTFTKALQEQIRKECNRFFPHIKITTLKGKNNFICRDKLSVLPAEQAEILTKVNPPGKIARTITVTSEYCRPQYLCPQRENCEYQKALIKAETAEIVVINHFLLKSFLWKMEEGCLLIVDECHLLNKALTREIHITEEVLREEPPEPLPAAFSTMQEYNLACENYLQLRKLKQLALEHGITTPGKYRIDLDISEELQKPYRCIFTSATVVVPENIEINDLYTVEDRRPWKRVKITIDEVSYKDPDYRGKLLQWIAYGIKNFPKTIVLATSYETLDVISSEFPQAATTRQNRAIELAEKMKAGQLSLIAGCDTLWTGIDIPGKKCIIMTKLPFPTPENSPDFTESRTQMLTRLKQGFGRMLRSNSCSGEIILLDSRTRLYPEVMEYLQRLQNSGATITWLNRKTDNLIRVAFGK